MYFTQYKGFRHLVMYLLHHGLVRCYILTPRAVADDIEIFSHDSNTLDKIDIGSISDTRPWVIYLDSSAVYSIVNCLKRMRKTKQMLTGWSCLFDCSPSCYVFENIIKNGCPEYKKITLDRYPVTRPILFDKLKSEDLLRPPVRNIVGGISASPEKCASFISFLDDRYAEAVFKRIVVNYKFKTNALLRLNITFEQMELTSKEGVHVINGYKCQEIFTYYKMFKLSARKNHNCFELFGRRPITNVISQEPVFLLKLYILEGEIKAIYQVTDATQITRHSSCLELPKLFELHFIWKTKISVFTSRITVSVYQRITINLTHAKGFQVFDGPGVQSRKLNIKTSELILSSFQTFIRCFVKTQDYKFNTLNFLQGSQKQFHQPYDNLGLSYHGTSINPVQVKISNSGFTALPKCRSNSVYYKVSESLHCVYNITSDSGCIYPNISIKELKYEGYASDSSFDPQFNYIPMTCIYGGIAYQVQGKKNTLKTIHMKHLCDNYTSIPFGQKSNDKSMMNIIGHSTEGHLIVVHSYKHYSKVSVDISLTTTACKGVHYYKEVTDIATTYTVPPEKCIVMQFISEMFFLKFNGKIKPLLNHRLLREDNVFLYPSLEGDYYFKAQHPQLLKNMKKFYHQPNFLYYLGRTINNPAVSCVHSECYFLKIRIERTRSWHLSVLYPGVLHPVYFTTRVVEQPTDIDEDLYDFSSFDFGSATDSGKIGSSHSWTSSTIYHVNCSRSQEEIINWSGLSHSVISDICRNESNKELVQVTHLLHTVIKPPISTKPHNGKPIIWSLVFSLEGVRNIQTMINTYGSVTIESNPIWTLCNKTTVANNRDSRLLLLKSVMLFSNDILVCAILKSKAQYSVDLLNKEGMIEMGFVLYDQPKIKFFPSEMLLKQLNASLAKAVFEWKSIEFVADKPFNKTWQFFQYKSTKFSWTLAEVKCKEVNMTLPSLSSRKATLEMIQHILQNNALPTYLLYVGLLRKNNIIKWLQQHPLIYYPWASDSITSLMSHDLIVDHDFSQHNLGNWGNLLHGYLSRKDYINKVKTTDGITSIYSDLYVKSDTLVKYLQSAQTSEPSSQCYALSLFDPLKPHLKLVNCYAKLLKSFYCQKPHTTENTAPVPTELSKLHYTIKSNLIKCSGEYISMIFICDGYQDCLDGKDELNCYCYVDGNRRNDSTYCSNNCSQHQRCSCSSFYHNYHNAGCRTYIDMQQSRKVLPETDLRNHTHYKCQKTNIFINSQKVNDLIFDCPLRDDEIELLTISSSQIEKCQNPDMIPCYPGHSKCYQKENTCIYNLTTDMQTLMYCRNGQHLQNCQTFPCFNMFKCPDSYCVPYKYLCDGKWDCFEGEDEHLCLKRWCNGMFKCRSSIICLDINNVCDNAVDCPYTDDESLCNLEDCIEDCVCLNHGVKCKFTSMPDKYLLSKLKVFLYIDLSESIIKVGYLNDMSKALILISKSNNMSSAFLCTNKVAKMKLKNIDCSFNMISEVHTLTFKCFPRLVQLNLSHNTLNLVGKFPFITLKHLLVLDLGHNKITTIQSSTFYGLHALNVLNLQHNTLLFISSDTFHNFQIKTILTDDFHICCLVQGRTTCSAEPSWPSSCNSLLSSPIQKIITWLIGISVVLFNLASVFYCIMQWCTYLKPNEYRQFVLMINISDLMTGISVFSIAVKDFLVKDDYVGQDLAWRSSIECHIVAFISLLSILISALLIFLVTLSRYNAVVTPFAHISEKGKYLKLTAYLIFVIAIILSIIIFVRNQVEGFTYISSPLCFLLGDTGQSMTLKLVTLSTSSYLLLILVSILCLYIRLIMGSKVNADLGENKHKERKSAITIHVVLAGITNALCWIPSSVFFLVSLFLDEFPVVYLYVMTLMIFPINAIANPIIFNSSLITKKLKEYNQRLFMCVRCQQSF